jgi:Ca2+-binding EF-hand superfamily protein
MSLTDEKVAEFKEAFKLFDKDDNGEFLERNRRALGHNGEGWGIHPA